MKATVIQNIINKNGLENIKQFSTTSLIRIFPERIKKGTFHLDIENEVLSFIDIDENTNYVIDTVDINGIVSKKDVVFK